MIELATVMLVTDFRCWWHLLNIGDQKWSKPSLTSYTCHQHIWSPTSLTNIDVTSWTIRLKLNSTYNLHFWSILRSCSNWTKNAYSKILNSRDYLLFGPKIILPCTCFTRYECIERSIHVINQKCVISWVTEVWFWFLVLIFGRTVGPLSRYNIELNVLPF